MVVKKLKNRSTYVRLPTGSMLQKALVKFCRSYLQQVLLTKETIKKLHFSFKPLCDSHSYSVNLVLLFLQLNVFYNVRNKEMRRRRREAGEQEAFELYVKLVDSEVNSAHLYICTRWAGRHLFLHMPTAWCNRFISTAISRMCEKRFQRSSSVYKQ